MTVMMVRLLRDARAGAERRRGKSSARRSRGRRANSRRSWQPPSEPVAGVGVAHGQREEAEPEGQQDHIQHGKLPSDGRRPFVRRRGRLTRIKGAKKQCALRAYDYVPSAAYVFEVEANSLL